MTIRPGATPPRIASPGRKGGNRGPGQGGNRAPGKLPPSGAPVWTPAPVAWKPPVPEPLPPAPLLGPWGLLGAGAAVVAGGLWGMLNSRPKPGPTTPLVYLAADGQVGTTGGVVEVVISATQMQRTCSPSAGSKCYGPAITSTQRSVKLSYGAGGGDVVGITHSGYRLCGYDTVSVKVKSSGTDAVGTLQGSFISSASAMPACGDIIHYSVVLVYTGQGGALRNPVLPAVPVSWPDGFMPPEPEVEPSPLTPKPARPPALPTFPFPIGRPDPFAPVTPAPEPGPAPLPAVKPAQPLPAVVPIRPPGTASTENGQVVVPKPAPIPVTPADAVFPVPGGRPVLGNGPQPNLVSIAQELGRIERKMESVMNPQADGNPAPDWLDQLDDYWDAFQRISDLLTSIGAGGEYLMREPCDPEGDGVFVERRVPYAGALGPLGVIENKIDALAALMQAHKDLRQPVCPPPEKKGEGVTVRFNSLQIPPGDVHRLEKVLRYRDQSGSPLEAHWAHWRDFTWTSGPVIVTSNGLSWGKPRVWAATEGEGKRVLAHAAQIAAVNLKDPKHHWTVRAVSNPRYGRSEVVELKRLNLGMRDLTKRPGPDGPLEVIMELPPTYMS